MSRWQDTFNTHPFRTVWSQIKAEMEVLNFSDASVFPLVEEIARLKKAVRYLDKLLDIIDPELLPLNVWDNFNVQILSVLSELLSFKLNDQLGHLQNANSFVDGALSYVRPYMVANVTGADSLVESLAAYHDSLDRYREVLGVTLTNIESGSRAALAEINICLSSAKVECKEIGKILEDSKSDNEAIGKMASSAYNDQEEIGRINTNLVEIQKGAGTLLEEIESQHENIEELKVEADELLKEHKGLMDEIKEFHLKSIGKANDDSSSYRAQFEALQNAMSDFSVLQKERYEALNGEINALLPNATSAGLSSAFYEMKKSFTRSIWAYTALFVVTIFLLVAIGAVSIEGAANGWVVHVNDFSKSKSYEEFLVGFLQRLPFYSCLVWLALFATKRRSECQRLQQEYAHKESLSKSYDKFKRQIDELNSEDKNILEELIRVAISAIAHNPSSSLDDRHGDKMPIIEASHKTLSQTADLLKKLQDLMPSLPLGK